MNKLHNIKTIAFDYGGTLDLPGMHWFDFLWNIVDGALREHFPVTRETYWEAYVYGERELEKHPISPDTGLLGTLLLKSGYEVDYLAAHDTRIPAPGETKEQLATLLASAAVKSITDNTYKESLKVLTALSRRYPLYIVSNYYGNLNTVLREGGFLPCLSGLIDSTTVGIRKPDPAIWKLAVERAGVSPAEMLVVGDSMKNDILPALSTGCRAVWLCPSPQDCYEGLRISTLSELLDML